MTNFHHSARGTRISLLAAMALLVSCGGDGGLSPEPAPATQPPSLMLSGVAVNKFRASGNDWGVLTERLRPLVDVTAPDRGLLLSPGNGQTLSAEPLLAVLPAAPGPAQRLPLPAGLRQNQVRTVAAWLHGWVIGGLQNGPGTHSADSDPALLTCDGFFRPQDF
jgi:hypothetical protein